MFRAPCLQVDFVPQQLSQTPYQQPLLMMSAPPQPGGIRESDGIGRGLSESRREDALCTVLGVPWPGDFPRFRMCIPVAEGRATVQQNVHGQHHNVSVRWSCRISQEVPHNGVTARSVQDIPVGTQFVAEDGVDGMPAPTKQQPRMREETLQALKMQVQKIGSINNASR